MLCASRDQHCTHLLAPPLPLHFLSSIFLSRNTQWQRNFPSTALAVGGDVLAKAKEGRKKVGSLKVFLFTDVASGYSDDGL